MRQATFTWPVMDATAICATQTATNSTLVINGGLQDKPATMQGVFRAVMPGIERTVNITSTGNISGVVFTITGLNLRGETVATTLTGPNATTATTVVTYNKVTSITTDVALSIAASVGTGSTGQTNWWMASTFPAPTNIAVGVAITATMSVTVQNTFDNLQTATSYTTFALAAITAATTSTQASYTTPPGAVRAVVNSSDATAAMTFTIFQAGQ